VRRRDVAAVLAIASLATAAVQPLAPERLDGLSVDVLFFLRHHLAPSAPPARPPVAVVAIDEETYRRPPFADTPRVMWTKALASTLTALVDGGAAAVGFDVIYPTSVEQYVPGFDRDFLRALRAAAQAGKVVLGKVQHQAQPILPFEGQRIAVGRGRNVHAANAVTDADDVVRRLPLFLESADTGAAETGIALELASRALAQPPERLPAGGVALGGYRIPGSAENRMLINFRGGFGAIPSYSLADLVACAEKGAADYFRRHFAGRIVLVGTMLDVEDRKVTSKRFITGPEGPASAERCVHPAMAGLFDERRRRDEIPGVIVHAQAIENLVRGEALRELPRWSQAALALLPTAGAAAAALLLAPAWAAAALAVGAAGWAGAATAALTQAVVVPLLAPLAAAALAFAAMLGYRFTVADKDKRVLRKSFQLYLAPALIDRMLASERPPELGGEDREVTIFFSDVAGFSSFSEKMTPKELVALMNEYLSEMTDIIEAHHGYVERYMGDAIVALFGAPIDDPGHALSATRAALACGARLAEMNRGTPAFRGYRLAHRIGVSTGPMLVGNIGSKRRFNYTAMGDLANLGARLEGANKYYGTAIMVSEETRRRAGDAITWRELDLVRVKGREHPERVYEPLAEAAAVPEPVRAAAEVYAAALARWRQRDFAGAAALFERVADRDPAAKSFLSRARAQAAAPPDADWEPVTTLEGK
jgi:class 3 adenylate cyclase/CHASE2 domain-containing sensor protein